MEKKLRWNHSDTLMNAAKTVGRKTNMIYSPDVTLVFEDGAKEWTHKLMLSAYSKIFHKLFVNSPNCDLVIMTDYNVADFLEFIYVEKMNPVSEFKREDLDKKKKNDQFKQNYDAKVKSMIKKSENKIVIGSNEYSSVTCKMCIFPDKLRSEVVRHI